MSALKISLSPENQSWHHIKAPAILMSRGWIQMKIVCGGVNQLNEIHGAGRGGGERHEFRDSSSSAGESRLFRKRSSLRDDFLVGSGGGTWHNVQFTSLLCVGDS
ncbi:hypothetical protein CDAR_524741 [Caerostris darwini]|uniref:Uncharacterized protein n=1 Tax=Caerostris darwini TaxID=1538125 RepID=A0AAV4QZW1_9ARAC|nr:hypothetical protein CDAR_524741 [Caerostris darwini]